MGDQSGTADALNKLRLVYWTKQRNTKEINKIYKILSHGNINWKEGKERREVREREREDS